MKDPLVSVVMPSYNSEKYIAESIQSIIDQTFMEWEFIIVDGHSNDRTTEIIENYIAKDSRIKLIFDEKKGIGAALHMGCLSAKGKYIARMDSDDISRPNRLKCQVEYMESHPKTVLTSCIFEEINDRSELINIGIPYTNKYLIKKNPASICHPGVIMRKDVYLKAGGYPPLKRAEDNFLWHRMMKYGDVKIIENPLIRYRVSNESLSGTMNLNFYYNVNNLWKIIAANPHVGIRDFDYLNYYIEQNIQKDPKRDFKPKKVEKQLYLFMKRILSEKMAIFVILRLKNIYGLLKYGI